MAPPRWRAKLLLLAIGALATLIAAWVYVPDVKEAAGVLGGDVKAEAVSRGAPAP